MKKLSKRKFSSNVESPKKPKAHLGPNKGKGSKPKKSHRLV